MDGSLSQFSLRLALVAAAAASVAVLTGLFSDPVRYACLGVIVVATLATVAERRRHTVGGLFGVVGGALVVIAETIGFPAGDA